MASEMGTIITIDNYGTQMLPFNPEGGNKSLYGLVDMGSNGIRFSISDLSPPRSRLLNCLYRERAGISLYDALHESTPDSKPFYFSQNTIERVAETLGRFRSICDGYGVPKDNIQVFATEAMRTSKNRDEILAAIKMESGLTVDILSPAMESLFGAMGARSGFNSVNGLFMDLGGGSVQMTYVNSEVEEDYDVLAAEMARSKSTTGPGRRWDTIGYKRIADFSGMPFGAAKLTLALSSQSTAQEAKTELRSKMRETYELLVQKFPHLKEQADSSEGINIYFCGGGFRGYGSMLMHTDPIQPYPISSIGGYTVPGSRFTKWREMLHANNYEDGKIFGMSKRRREQFPAIVTVVQSLIEAIPKIKQVTFCSGGNREGVLFMKLPREVRESHPIPLLPAGVEHEETLVQAATETIISALPNGRPSSITKELIHYITRNIWQNTGDSDDTNSANALHAPISGLLAGLPGITHEDKAIIALTLSARWGSDLGSGDLKTRDNLRAIIGAELSWWCDFIGTICRLLALLLPVFPANSNAFEQAVRFEAATSHGLGKKGHKVGIRLKIFAAKSVRRGLSDGAVEKLFDKVGKGVGLGWKVEAEVVDL